MASFNACSSHGWRDLSAGASAVSILSMHATKRHHPFWAISGSGRPSGALSQLARARGLCWWPGHRRPRRMVPLPPRPLRQLTAYVAGVLLGSANGARWSIEATDQRTTETVCRHGQVIAHYVSETDLAGPGADLSPMAVAARW
jgi:hypothetical protein